MMRAEAYECRAGSPPTPLAPREKEGLISPSTFSLAYFGSIFILHLRPRVDNVGVAINIKFNVDVLTQKMPPRSYPSQLLGQLLCTFCIIHAEPSRHLLPCLLLSSFRVPNSRVTALIRAPRKHGGMEY